MATKRASDKQKGENVGTKQRVFTGRRLADLASQVETGASYKTQGRAEDTGVHRTHTQNAEVTKRKGDTKTKRHQKQQQRLPDSAQ